MKDKKMTRNGRKMAIICHKFSGFSYKLCFIQSRFRHFSFVKDFIIVAKKMSRSGQSFVSFGCIQTTFTGEKCIDLRNLIF